MALGLSSWLADRGYPIGGMTFAPRRRITVAEIQHATARAFNVDIFEMTSDRRSRAVARPRQVAMFLSAKLTPKGPAHIGRLFNRDHTTVIYAVRHIEDLRAKDEVVAAGIVEVERRLQGWRV